MLSKHLTKDQINKIRKAELSETMDQLSKPLPKKGKLSRKKRGKRNVDDFFSSLEKKIRERQAGSLRACADDIGAALRAKKYIKLLKPISDSAESFAGLSLRPSKCYLVVLSRLDECVKYNIKNMAIQGRLF